MRDKTSTRYTILDRRRKRVFSLSAETGKYMMDLGPDIPYENQQHKCTAADIR